MAAKDRVNTTVGYTIDQASVDRAVDSARVVAAGYEKLEDQLDRLTPAANRLIPSIEGIDRSVRVFDASTRRLVGSVEATDAAFFSIPRSVQDFNAVIEQTERSELRLSAANDSFVSDLRADIPVIDAATDAVERYTTAVNTPLTPQQQSMRDRLLRPQRGGGGLEGIDRAGAIGSQIFSGLGQGELANVSGLIGDATGAIGAFGLAALPVTATLGIGASLLATYNEGLQKNIERAGTYAEAISAAFEAGTTAQIQELVRQQENEIRIAEATRQVLEREREDARAQLALQLDNASTDLVNFLNETAAGIFGGGEMPELARDAALSIESYNAQVDEQQRLIDQAQLRLDAYNLVLGENATATADAAEASADLAPGARLSAVATRELAAAAKDLEIAAQEAARAGLTARPSAAALRELAEAAKALEVAVSAASRPTGGVSATIAKDLELLARAARETAITELVDQFFDANTRVLETTQNLEKANAALQKVDTDLAAREADIVAAASDKRFAVIERAEAAKQELEQKAAQDEIKARKEYWSAVEDIARRAESSLLDAQRRRDVTSAIRATEQQAEAVRQEDKSLSDRLETIDDNLRDQNKVIDERLDEQIRAIRKSMDDGIRLERRRADEERAIRRQAVDAARVDLQNAESAQRLLQKQHHLLTQNAEVSHQQNMENIYRVGTMKIVDGVIGELNKGMQRIGGSGVKGSGGVPPLNLPLAPLGSTQNTPFAFTSPTAQARQVNINVQGLPRDVAQRTVIGTMRQIWAD